MMTATRITLILMFFLSLIASVLAFSYPSASPLEGKIAEAYANGFLYQATELHKNNPTENWGYDDQVSLALAYFYIGDSTSALEQLEKPIVSTRLTPIIRALRSVLTPGYDEALRVIKKEKLDAGVAVLLRASAALLNNRNSGAIEEYESISNLDKLLDGFNLRLYYLQVCKAYFNVRNLRASYAILNKAIDIYPNFLPYHELRVVLAIEGKIPLKAISYLNICEKLGSSDYFLAYNRGRAYYGVGNNEEGEKYLSEAIAINGRIGKTYLMRGNCRRYLDLRKEAMEDFSRAYNLDPTLASALVNLAVLTFLSGEIQVARQIYDEAIFSHPDFQSAYVERANFFTAIGMVEEANADYVKAIELSPNDPYPPYMAARLHAEYLNADKAREFAELAISIDPDYGRVYVVLGDLARNQGDYQTSANEYRKSLSLNEFNLDAARGLARVLLEMRDTRGAIIAAKKALTIAKNDHNSLYLLGMALLSKGDFGTAEQTFFSILSTDEGFAPAYYGLSLIQFARSELVTGVNYLQSAIRWKPDPKYMYIRAVMGIIDPKLSIGNEKEIIEEISSAYEKHTFEFLDAALKKDPKAAMKAAREIKSLDLEKYNWLTDIIIRQLESDRAFTRPPFRNPYKRTTSSFYLSLALYAKGDLMGARQILQFCLRSNDYLSPEFYFSRILFSRLMNSR